MELHTLKPADGAKRKPKRVGRGAGSGHGKTSGRGHKGQQARSGYKRKAAFEGGQMPLNRRLPKRGFGHEKRHPFAEVNIDVLGDRFEDGAEITTSMLQELGIVKKTAGGVKLLGRGELAKRFVIRVNAASESARRKVEAAGGTLEIIPALGAAK